ncbi:MAG: TetR/AcrR family transcriptional regulator [Syntrophomonadaceae bacterium]
MGIKERVLKACQELILDYGYRGFSMDQLASLAGVSKRTLYRHFASRDAVIEATLNAFMQKMAGVADSLIQNEKDPVALIKAMFTAITTEGQFALNTRSMEDLRRFYPHLWIMIDDFRQERLRSIFALFSSQGYIKNVEQVNPSIALQVVSSAIQNVLNPDFLLNNNLSFQAACLDLSKIMLYGLLGSSGEDGLQTGGGKESLNA